MNTNQQPTTPTFDELLRQAIRRRKMEELLEPNAD